MFEVYDKRIPIDKPRVTTVFDVRNDSNGYPHFLVYEKGSWVWVSAKHFKPTRYTK